MHTLGLPLPPAGVPAIGPGAPRVPLLRAARPLKRWRYVAAFGPELMLCAGDARIGPLRQRWWALAEPGTPVVERRSPISSGLSLTRTSDRAGSSDAGTTVIRGRSRRASFALEVDERHASGTVEVVSPAGRDAWIWTRKRAGLPASATVELRGRRRELELEAVVDDSAGYHERHTVWSWSTGVGRAESGERVAWNLVSGIHDSGSASERAVWVEGAPTETGPALFADDLARVETSDGGALDFTPWSTRVHDLNLLLVRSAYRQPFGTFSGVLPGGLRLAEGYGVMEHHDVRW